MTCFLKESKLPLEKVNKKLASPKTVTSGEWYLVTTSQSLPLGHQWHGVTLVVATETQLKRCLMSQCLSGFWVSTKTVSLPLRSSRSNHCLEEALRFEKTASRFVKKRKRMLSPQALNKNKETADQCIFHAHSTHALWFLSVYLWCYCWREFIFL